MEYLWVVPDEGFVKINVHCVMAQNPMDNGNLNGAAAIIRDTGGERLWMALGSLPGLTEEQATVTAIHAACEHALSKGWDAVQIETVSPRVYDNLSLQDDIFLDDDQRNVYRNINTLFANNFKEGTTKRNVACIPQFMNSTAEYLANFGLANYTDFGEVKNSVGDLDFHLARDMGRTLIQPVVAVNQILGDGEIIDGPPPPKKRRMLSPSPSGMAADKVMLKSNFVFKDNGIKTESNIDGGYLSSYSGDFAKKVVNFFREVA